MVITNADENDYAALKEILENIKDEDKNIKNMPLYSIEFNNVDYDIIKVVNKHGRIVGFLVAKPYLEMVDILGAVVEKDYRNKGVGKRLFFAIEHLYPTLDLIIKTPTSIPKNIAFYKSLGYLESKSGRFVCEPGIMCFEKIR